MTTEIETSAYRINTGANWTLRDHYELSSILALSETKSSAALINQKFWNKDPRKMIILVFCSQHCSSSDLYWELILWSGVYLFFWIHSLSRYWFINRPFVWSRQVNLKRLDKKPSLLAHQCIDLSLSLSLFLTVMMTGVLKPTSNYKYSVIDLHTCDEFAMRLATLRRIVRSPSKLKSSLKEYHHNWKCH